jgi:hypothetical protein
MLTTLWDMFVSALRFTRGTAQAAVAVIQAAPAAQAPVKLIDAASGDVTAPTTATDGANIEGIKTVNLVWKNTVNGTSTFTLHLWDGEEWVVLETIEAEGMSGVLPPLDAEGFSRIGASILGADISGGGAFTLKLFPHNQEP